MENTTESIPEEIDVQWAKIMVQYDNPQNKAKDNVESKVLALIHAIKEAQEVGLDVLLFTRKSSLNFIDHDNFDYFIECKCSVKNKTENL